jgi:hypothetical protein
MQKPHTKCAIGEPRQLNDVNLLMRRSIEECDFEAKEIHRQQEMGSISKQRHGAGIRVSQAQYVKTLLQRFDMNQSNQHQWRRVRFLVRRQERS